MRKILTDPSQLPTARKSVFGWWCTGQNSILDTESWLSQSCGIGVASIVVSAVGVAVDILLVCMIYGRKCCRPGQADCENTRGRRLLATHSHLYFVCFVTITPVLSLSLSRST